MTQFLVGFALILTFVTPAFGQSATNTERLTADALEGFPDSVVMLARESDIEADGLEYARVRMRERVAKAQTELLAEIKRPSRLSSFLEIHIEKFDMALVAAAVLENFLREKDGLVRSEYRGLITIPTAEQAARFDRWEKSHEDNYFFRSADHILIMEEGLRALKKARQ